MASMLALMGCNAEISLKDMTERNEDKTLKNTLKMQKHHESITLKMFII